MEAILLAMVFGTLSGTIGTGIGGVIVLSIKEIKDKLLGILLGFSAGIMTAIIFLDLIPEASEAGTLTSALLGILLGVGLIALIDIKFPHQHFSFSKDMHEENQRYLKTGLLLGVGIALHNIPEGIAIGAGYISSPAMGISLAVMLALHNLPEGMAVATALSLAELKKRNILIITVVTGVPMGVGAFIGGFLGGISEWFLSIALGFAGGAMLYIVYDELIPDAHNKTDGHAAIIGIISGVIAGMILIDLLH